MGGLLEAPYLPFAIPVGSAQLGGFKPFPIYPANAYALKAELSVVRVFETTGYGN
jgi:hypothetical protein